MATKQAVRALRPFNRNLDGGMIVGSPRHRAFGGRFLLVSPETAETLVGRGDAEKIDMADYYEAEQRYNRDGGFRNSEAPKSGLGDRPRSTDVRVAQTGGTAQTGEGEKPRVNMSKAKLREIAEARGIDLEAFDAAANNSERVKLIEGGNGQGGGETDAGRVASMTVNSTNHPDGLGGQTSGLAAEDDAAPTGGGGGAPA